MSAEGVRLKGIPVIHALPWAHRGRGVIVDSRKRVLGAFESSGDAEAVVAVVNALALTAETGGRNEGS